MINFAYSEATYHLKRGMMLQKDIAKRYCRVPFKKIRPDFMEDEATDAHSFYILMHHHHMRMDVKLSVYFHSINGFLGRNCPASELRQAP